MSLCDLSKCVEPYLQVDRVPYVPVRIGVVSRYQEGLTRMMTTITVEVFGEFRLTVSEKKLETLLMRAPEK